MREAWQPGPVEVTPDDLSVMPYTSGTTGRPKGCMHTHRSVMYQILATGQWVGAKTDSVALAALPLFHVTGMQSSMNIPLFNGNTVVLLPRWDREVAAQCIERYRVTSWTCIPTMVVDFLANPTLADYDLSSLARISGGGAAMPAAVAQTLLQTGADATSRATASRRRSRRPTSTRRTGRASNAWASRSWTWIRAWWIPRRCRTAAPARTRRDRDPRAAGVPGLLAQSAKPTPPASCEIDGKRFFRTGDLARVDEDGYFFMVDRLKRMINASGLKVWPAEVESLMYGHPAIQEACVIGARDAHRGETVKAVVVLRPGAEAVSEQSVVDWCRRNMAAYKAPRIVEFVDSLPKSATGKIMWRALQEKERAGS